MANNDESQLELELSLTSVSENKFSISASSLSVPEQGTVISISKTITERRQKEDARIYKISL